MTYNLKIYSLEPLVPSCFLNHISIKKGLVSLAADLELDMEKLLHMTPYL
ncbi:hypothetical protein [Candidatus Tisiphia endosymbiont of Nedyus quadrimaculatus]